MQDLQLFGEMPSPYGPLVRVIQDLSCADEDMSFHFDVEGVMTMGSRLLRLVCTFLLAQDRPRMVASNPSDMAEGLD